MLSNQRISKTVKFTCNYGGEISPRQFDGNLRYVGGFTRILAVDRSITFSELMVKLGEFCGYSVKLKCLLPKGEFDTLISITSDEDLSNLLEEYDRASSSLPHPLNVKSVLSRRKSVKKSSAPSFDHFLLDSKPDVRAAKLQSRPRRIREDMKKNGVKIVAVEEPVTRIRYYRYDLHNRLIDKMWCDCPHCVSY